MDDIQVNNSSLHDSLIILIGQRVSVRWRFTDHVYTGWKKKRSSHQIFIHLFHGTILSIKFIFVRGISTNTYGHTQCNNLERIAIDRFHCLSTNCLLRVRRFRCQLQQLNENRVEYIHWWFENILNDRSLLRDKHHWAIEHNTMLADDCQTVCNRYCYENLVDHRFHNK